MPDQMPGYATEKTRAFNALRLAIVAGDKKAIGRAETQARKANEAWLEENGDWSVHRDQPDKRRHEQALKERKKLNQKLIKSIHAQFEPVGGLSDSVKVAATKGYLSRDLLQDSYLHGTEAQQKAATDRFREAYSDASRRALTEGGYDLDDPETRTKFESQVDEWVGGAVDSGKKYPGILEKNKEQRERERSKFDKASRERAEKAYAQPIQSYHGRAFRLAKNAGDGPGRITTGDPDLDGDGKVEKGEAKIANAKESVAVANIARLDLSVGPDSPRLRDAHGNWLKSSESLAVAVADYKDSQPNNSGDKTSTSTKTKKKAVTEGGGILPKEPKYHKRSGRGKKGMKG